ncbi:MAG: hypothetical protein ABIW02_03035 [Nitrosospira sp.]
MHGDIVILNEGDRVPADAILFECTNISVDGVALTGESLPVHKLANGSPRQSMGTPGGANRLFFFSGTLVVQGIGLAQVSRRVRTRQSGVSVGFVGDKHEIPVYKMKPRRS